MNTITEDLLGNQPDLNDGQGNGLLGEVYKLQLNYFSSLKSFCTANDVTPSTMTDVLSLEFAGLASTLNLVQRIQDKQGAVIQLTSQKFEIENKGLSGEDLNINSSYQAVTTYISKMGLPRIFSTMSLAQAETSPLTTSSLWDVGYAFDFDKSIDTIKNASASTINTSFSDRTDASNQMATDWNTSSSGGFAIFSISNNISDKTTIQQDFNNLQTMGFSAK